MGLEIELLSARHLDFCQELRQLEGWNQTTGEWRFFLRASPHGCFLGSVEGLPAGTITTIDHGGRVGWIGMLLVHPNFRGRGLGRALLERAIEHLRERVEAIKLDATPKGEPLYRRLGFQLEWQLERHAAVAVTEAGSAVPGIRRAARNDFESIVRLDAEAFGAARGELIDWLLDRATTCFVLEAGSRLDGFGFVRDGARARYLGPVAARSGRTAESLITALCAASRGGELYWDLPIGNLEAVKISRNLRFNSRRPLTRMFLGEKNISGELDQYFGIADPAFG